MLRYNEQIELIKRLQEFFYSLKPLAIFLNYLDTTPIYVLLIIVIWVTWSRKLGFRTLVALGVSGIVNLALKQFYDAPRPLAIDPTAAWLHIPGYGFPSGGAMNSLLLFLILTDGLKNKKIKFVLFPFVLLISWSRIVLGAHFFTDVIGGWVVAIVLYFAYKKLFLPNEEMFFPIIKKKNLKRCCLLLLIFPFFFLNQNIWNMAFFTIGALVANFYFPCKELEHATIKVRGLLGLLCLAIVLPLEQLLAYEQFTYLIYLVIGFIMFPISQKILRR